MLFDCYRPVRRTPPGSPDTLSTLTAVDDDDGNDVSTVGRSNSLRSVDMKTLADDLQCLNDNIINAAQQMLSRQYTSISGLKDTVAVAASTCDVLLDSDNTSNSVQIVHDSVKEHWLCITNKHCLAGNLRIYCSLHMTPSAQCLATVAKLFRMQSPSLTVDIMNVVRQRGAVDCGLFAIAYAEILARDQHPCNVNLDQIQMRRHLMHCLEANRITPFPVTKFRTLRHPVVRSVVVSLYCVCRSTHLPGEKMLQCDQCHEWFHQHCVGISDEMFQHLARTTAHYSCPRCTSVNNVDHEQLGARKIN